MIKELTGRYAELHGRQLSEDGTNGSRLVLPPNFDINILTPGMVIKSPDPMFRLGTLVSLTGGYVEGNTRELIGPLDEGYTFHAFLHRSRNNGKYVMATSVLANNAEETAGYRGEILGHKYFGNGARHNWAA